jgi:hypothetical protein
MKGFFVFFFSLLCGIALYVGYKNYFVHPKPIPHIQKIPPSKFSLEHAPITSLRGQILSLTGDVAIQSRIATGPARIIAPVPVQQGEKVRTEAVGSTTIQLGENTIRMQPDSLLEFVQTLSSAVVLRQEIGTISYTNPKDQLSVRSMHLLAKLEEATATISADPASETITLAVESGKATVGFNDSEQVSTVVQIKNGYTYVFDDRNREGILKKNK